MGVVIEQEEELDEVRPGVARARQAVAGHIPGLDGLRAFAVLAVLAYHLWPNAVPGGFLGVDVFFVISGFLITTLLVREHERAGRVDLPSFWLRRARRLLPALVLVVVTSIVVGAFVERDLLVGIDRQVVGALTFSTNWIELRAGADYFDHTAPTMFATFWSLAVEEQFYLVWPLALIGLLAVVRTWRGRVATALGVAVASALLMAVLVDPGGNPTRVYYGTDTHLAGLMLGAALALAFAGGVGVVAQRRWLRLRQWIGYPALALLVVLVFAVRSESTWTYRGGLVLASLLAAVVVAALPGSPTALSRLGDARPLAWVGARSYGIYLWHWPVLLLVSAARPAVAPGDPPAFLTVVLTVLLTLGLSEASYRWVETPIRRKGFFGDWVHVPAEQALWLGTAGVVLVAAVVVATAPEKSEAQRAVERGLAAIADQSSTTTSSVVVSSDGTTPSSVPPSTATSSPVDGAVTTVVGATSVPPGGHVPAWPVGQAEPRGDQIIGFGDSVMSGAAPALYERFPGIVLDAVPIRQWKDAPGVVEAALASGANRPVVVLNFGTNAGLVSDQSKQALRKVLDDLGPDRRVVLLNTVGTSSWVPSTNATLASIAGEYPNTIVADWHAVVAERPELLHNDRTHPNMGGIEVYAQLVATALQKLGP